LYLPGQSHKKYNQLTPNNLMIKRIIIITIFYAILITALTLAMPQVDEKYIVILTISGLLFGFLIIREVYKKYSTGFKQKNNSLNYINTDLKNLNKISTKPFLFGLEKNMVSENEFYFDNDNFYAINNDNQSVKFSLKDITEISKTSFQINNSRIWQVKIHSEHGEVIFKFAHNYTIWNKNFLTFYEKVKKLNPSVIKSKWSIWTM
jgi:hypothetical protein